jgi:transposase
MLSLEPTMRQEGRRVQDNHITIDLGLPSLVVEGQRDLRHAIIVEARFRQQERHCPVCRKRTGRVHQYHRQFKQHIALWGRPVFLLVSKRRFRCGRCDKVFMEPDEVCGWRRRCTRRLREHLARESLTRTVKGVAEQEEVGEALVRTAFTEMADRELARTSPTPRVLALDEFSAGPRQGFLTGLHAPERREVLDVTPGRSQATAEALLNQLTDGNRVEAVVMDMMEAYRQAVQVCCPQAAIVADKFHVLRHVLDALARLRVQAQERASAEGQRLKLWRRRALLAADPRTLSAHERRELAHFLCADRQLAKGWWMAQRFRRIYELSSREEAAAAIERWWDTVVTRGPAQFRRMRHILTHWREEILNYFDHRVTNGFAEGKNNRFKVIIRQGYGYRNMDNLIPRLLMTNRSLSTV